MHMGRRHLPLGMQAGPGLMGTQARPGPVTSEELTSNLDLTGEAARRAREIVDRRRNIEGGGPELNVIERNAAAIAADSQLSPSVPPPPELIDNIDTIDFMGDKPDIPANSPTSSGLSPFGAAFAAARREQEIADSTDPGGGRFMFDRGDGKGPREFHTGRADDLEADASAAASSVDTSTGGVTDASWRARADKADAERMAAARLQMSDAQKARFLKLDAGTGENLLPGYVRHPRPRDKPDEEAKTAPDSGIISSFYQWLLDQGKTPSVTIDILNRSLGDQDATPRN